MTTRDCSGCTVTYPPTAIASTKNSSTAATTRTVELAVAPPTTNATASASATSCPTTITAPDRLHAARSCPARTCCAIDLSSLL